MCGEKIRVASPRITQRGSPPRVRGKVAERCYTDCACGITPACAGKRTRRLQMRQDERDHPRVCGEKPTSCPVGSGMLGSPPRVRGKVTKYVCKPQGVGITPACAGKSIGGSDANKCPWDHPRVCGEKAAIFLAVCVPIGSPPRVRGKEIAHPFAGVISGITPACAGKRMAFAGLVHNRRDHPRVCGEKTKKIP